MTIHVNMHLGILHIDDYSHEQRSTARGMLAPNIYIHIHIYIYTYKHNDYTHIYMRIFYIYIYV